MRYNAVPWTELHAVINRLHAVLIPGRLRFGDNVGDGDERALVFVPSVDAFDWHVVKIGAQLHLQMPDSRFRGKKSAVPRGG